MHPSDQKALAEILRGFSDLCREFEATGWKWQKFAAGEPVEFVAAGVVIRVQRLSTPDLVVETVADLISGLPPTLPGNVTPDE